VSDPFKYAMVIFDSRSGRFPSDEIYHAALFRYPASERWPKIRGAIFRISAQYGFKKNDALSTQAYEKDNWDKSTKWTKFDYQNGEFVMVNAGLVKKKPKPPKVNLKEIEAMLAQRKQWTLDWIKQSYQKAGYNLSDEQVLKVYDQQYGKK
jgi:hypothetical protein